MVMIKYNKYIDNTNKSLVDNIDFILVIVLLCYLLNLFIIFFVESQKRVWNIFLLSVITIPTHTHTLYISLKSFRYIILFYYIVSHLPNYYVIRIYVNKKVLLTRDWIVEQLTIVSRIFTDCSVLIFVKFFFAFLYNAITIIIYVPPTRKFKQLFL